MVAFRNTLLRLVQMRKLITANVRTYSSKSDINYEIRPMRRSDIQGLYELLAENKWNMEKSYLECVFNTDPTGLVVVVKDDGEIIGHNGILAHSETIASSGMNIVKEGYRELGIGQKLFRRVMDVMAERNVGGTALSNRISFYHQFGWKIQSFTLHYSMGKVNKSFISEVPSGDFEVVPLKDVNFKDVVAYDTELHTVPRPVYLTQWALHSSANGYVALKSGRVVGYGVLRPADVGHKMFPLFADDPILAKALFCHLASHIPEGEDLIFVHPIENELSNQFVAANELTSYLSMTRLYNKWNIEVDINRVYSTSSTEYAIV
ncbi:Hypothetical predicted protein [Mytilus galloprovincialis]|uniref:N-acetyltransferase domain-containing protein n=1 Tax=Mytilus galloprovincialis TaxID=29158 RepID=A0A8B6GGU8_MYTGA|nr:Hypothetical predicted protein [Mytilus galloprovincialis]